MSNNKFIDTAKIFLQKNSPTLLFVGGVVLVVGGTVYACIKTRKLDDTLKETKDELDVVHQMHEDGNKPAEESAEEQTTDIVEYSDKAYHKDLVKIYGKAALNMAKLYGVPFFMMGFGFGMIFKSNCILSNRYTTAVAASLAADKAFNFYRKNVISELGEEADARFRSGLRKETAERPVIGEDGNPKLKKDGTPEVKKQDVLVPKDEGETLRYSPYARVFAKYCPFLEKSKGQCYGSKEWEDSGYYNLQFIGDKEAELDRRLQENGYLFYNEALEALGFDRCPMGQDVGWKVDHNDPLSDNHVKITIIPKGYSADSDEVQSCLKGGETDFIVDFNVYGNIRPFVWGDTKGGFRNDSIKA